MYLKCPLSLYFILELFLCENDDSSSVQYCLIEINGGVKTFRVPTLEDVLKHRVIVVTLSISMYLSTLGLQKGMDHTLYTTFEAVCCCFQRLI